MTHVHVRAPRPGKDQARRQMASRASRHGAAPPAADGGTRSDADERGARARCRRPRPTPARPAARSAALLDRARVPQQAPMPRASGRRRRRRAKSASARPAAAARHQQRRARLAAEPRAATSRGPRTSWRLMRAHGRRAPRESQWHARRRRPRVAPSPPTTRRGHIKRASAPARLEGHVYRAGVQVVGSATEIAPATESEVAPQKLSLVILLRWSRPTRRARKPEHFGAPSPDRRG